MNQLTHLTEFQDILAHYEIADSAKTILAKTRLALLAGVSSSGRNTIIPELVKTGHFAFIASDTTREPRTNDGIPEQNGVNYWFRSEAQLLADLKAGKFIEAAIIHNQQVSGISLRELIRIHDSGKIGTTDIETTGVEHVIRVKPNGFAIFVLPPNFDEWQHRIKLRGAMDPAEYRRRLESACREFAIALEKPYYLFVINDTVPSAAAHINDIAYLGRYNNARQVAGKQLAQHLLNQTQSYLKQLA